MKEKLLEEVLKAKDLLKDFSTFKHLMSDGPEGDLAELYKTVTQIETLLKMVELKDVAHPKNKVIKDGIFHESGILVKVKPCGEEYKNKTYLGFYLGDLALGSSISINEDKIQLNFAGYNPAIFIPELKKIIYGYESWWGEIKDESELSEITTEDVNNVWYVQLLKAMKEKDSPQKEG